VVSCSWRVLKDTKVPVRTVPWVRKSRRKILSRGILMAMNTNVICVCGSFWGGAFPIVKIEGGGLGEGVIYRGWWA